jgi:hypothetical protein
MAYIDSECLESTYIHLDAVQVRAQDVRKEEGDHQYAEEYQKNRDQ